MAVAVISPDTPAAEIENEPVADAIVTNPPRSRLTPTSVNSTAVGVRANHSSPSRCTPPTRTSRLTPPIRTVPAAVLMSALTVPPT